MGTAAMCTVTVTGEVLGFTLDLPPISVPSSPTGIITVTIPTGIPLVGDIVLVGIPCPTIEDIIVEIGTVVSLTISVSETPA
ncbi:hypothetical protein [Cytobacillus firmus]|jgi:hypothetical protein|uniref:hypothetical protein n=1 Tax=Cytobacillus firmus TaxID=1399 RepID=UPI002162AA0F|nr:hypothetical protein [Cytobacillus firmus]MCS0673864.1 hypothetical protein [Cytobacillus firmus]